MIITDEETKAQAKAFLKWRHQKTRANELEAYKKATKIDSIENGKYMKRTLIDQMVDDLNTDNELKEVYK